MDTKDFLNLVLPANEPYYVLQLINQDTAEVRAYFPKSVDELLETATTKAADRWNTYYGVATYTAPTRDATSISRNKLLVLDVDFKKYTSAKDCQLAVNKFLVDSGLESYAYIVLSGKGAHIYFVPEKATKQRQVWLSYARGLLALTRKHGLIVDPGVTTNSNGLIRLPGSVNHSKTPTCAARLVRGGAPIPIDALPKLIPPKQQSVHISTYIDPATIVDPTIGAILGVEASNCRHLARSSIVGEGCAYIKFALEEPDSVTEPLWRGILSIAKNCDDGAKAIHNVSKGYWDYSAQETEHKAAQIKGPYSCDSMENAAGLDLCRTCKYKGLLGANGGPILLGRPGFIALPKPVKPEPAVAPPSTVAPPNKVYTDAELQARYTAPYYRAPGGGVQVALPGDPDENGITRTFMFDVCPYDFYPTSVIREANNAVYIEFFMHLPHGNVVDMRIGCAHAGKPAELIAEVGKHGMPIQEYQKKEFSKYVWETVKNFQKTYVEVEGIDQFGWSKDRTTFAIGERLITREGTTECVLGNALTEYRKGFTQAGSLAEWTRIVDLFNTPSCTIQAFVLFAAFMIPFLQLLDSDIFGFTISLFSKLSGTGKTTALMAAASIYGNHELQMSFKSTDKRRANRFARLRNIPAIIDELTTLDGESKRELAYEITTGKSGGGMQRNGLIERSTYDWCTGMFISGNSSMLQDIRNEEESADGPAKRIVEFECKALSQADKARCKDDFLLLRKNYGLAGDVFIRAILNDTDKFHQAYADAKLEIVQAVNAEPADRYWITIGALALSGGRLAKELGLHNIEIEPVKELITQTIKEHKENSQLVMANLIEDFLSNFIAQNYAALDDGRNLRLALNGQPLRTPAGQYKDGVLYIRQTSFKKYCKEQKQDVLSVLATLKLRGEYRGEARRRISKGCNTQRCYEFRINDVDIMQEPDFDPVGTAIAG